MKKIHINKLVILQAIFPAFVDLMGRYNRSGDQQKVLTENKQI